MNPFKWTLLVFSAFLFGMALGVNIENKVQKKRYAVKYSDSGTISFPSLPRMNWAQHITPEGMSYINGRFELTIRGENEDGSN
jgi:hypothetical protein